MENLAPTFHLFLNLKISLEKGRSVRLGLESFIRSDDSDFRNYVQNWMIARDRGTQICHKTLSIYQRKLLDISERGLRGESVYQILCSIEPEILQACDNQLQNWISSLPIKLLIPLFFFQLPAFLILLFGPMLKSLVENF